MKVAKARSIEKLYNKVRNYDIVFTSEASIMSALNDRLEEPVLGHFATTPMIYTFDRFQNQELLQERGLFIETVKNTDLSWKQSSYLLENILDCWKHKGSKTSIKQYTEFDAKSVQKILDVIIDTDNVYSRMEEIEIDDSKDVAVVDFDGFNEIDEKVLPEQFDEFELLRDERTKLERFKLYHSATEIVRTIVRNVEENTAQDIAVVLDQSSSYSTLVESALESNDKDLSGNLQVKALLV